jgi:hypothetical protein
MRRLAGVLRIYRLSNPQKLVSSYKEINVKMPCVHKPLSAFILAALTSPAMVHADCIPTAPVGYTVPFRMVSLENFRAGSNPIATYADGGLKYTAHETILFRGTTLSGTDNQQLFNTRTYCRGTFLECSNVQFQQPFDIDQSGSLSLSISDGENLLEFPPSGAQILVTFNNKQFYNGTCDATSGNLYFSGGDYTYVVTFGTPAPPPPKPT